MSVRLSRTLFSQLARPVARSAGRNAGRRMMSSGSPAGSSDKTWAIGSAVIFGPLALYLLSPTGQDKAHKAQQHAEPKIKGKTPDEANATSESTPLPTKDDEGTEVPAAAIQASAQTAFNEDSPKDAKAAEKTSSGESDAITDSEGSTASSAEIKESMTQAFNEDSPQDAQSAEETKGPYDNSTPPPDTEHEQKEKPGKEKTSDTQTEEGHTDQATARTESTSGSSPKETSEKKEKSE